MGARADTQASLEAVVQRYMAAVRENRKSDADEMLAKLHVGYPSHDHRGHPRRQPTGARGFDWFGYFRDHGFAVSETIVREQSELWAIVEAGCTAREGSQANSRHTVLFRLFRERGSWLISDISLTLDADIRRDEPQ